MAIGVAGRPASLKYGTPTNLSQQAGDIVYNAWSQPTSMNIGAAGTNQINEQYAFDPLNGLLTNQKAVRSGTTLMDLSYDYDRNSSAGSQSGKTGSLTKIADNLNSAKDREYVFDALGRLTQAKGGATGNLWSQSYSYDRFGNKTSVSAEDRNETVSELLSPQRRL